jgi:hypothetical protein
MAGPHSTTVSLRIGGNSTTSMAVSKWTDLQLLPLLVDAVRMLLEREVVLLLMLLLLALLLLWLSQTSSSIRRKLLEEPDSEI